MQTRHPQDAPEDDPAREEGEGANGDAGGLALVLGRNLRRLRMREGLSLERLARVSHVSRAMLSQIENGKSAPTINIVWKIATALNVPFSTLFIQHDGGGSVVLRQDEAKILGASEGRFSSRALFPFESERRTEFYEVRIAGRHSEVSEPHPAGTGENIFVAHGTIEVVVGKEKGVILSEGDALFFIADRTHRYRNLGSDEAVLYMVMSYVETVG